MAQTRLKQLREEAVLTVHELAEASGVSDDTISKIENGQRAARPNTLRKLARVLGVSPQELRRPARVDEPALAGKGEAPREAGQPELTEAWRKFYENLFTLPAQPLIEQSDEVIALYRESAEKAARGEKPIVAGFLEDESPERARLAAEALRIIEKERRQERARR